MKVRLNEDKEIVARIKEGLKRTGGYCPCRLAHTEENKCMCEEFRNQIKDPNFEGYCHCIPGAILAAIIAASIGNVPLPQNVSCS